jgi:hypothetical protein
MLEFSCNRNECEILVPAPAGEARAGEQRGGRAGSLRAAGRPVRGHGVRRGCRAAPPGTAAASASPGAGKGWQILPATSSTPRLFVRMASYDVASKAHCRQVIDTRFESSIPGLNGIL